MGLGWVGLGWGLNYWLGIPVGGLKGTVEAICGVSSLSVGFLRKNICFWRVFTVHCTGTVFVLRLLRALLK